MKFGHDLLQLEAGAPDALRGQFIQYKQLKKLLKQLPAAEDRTEAEQEFFRRLRAEVQAVNQRFEKAACEVLRQASVRRRHAAAAKARCWCLRRRRVSSQEEEVLAAQAHWCRRYARANAAGLRKIAKKHDKQAANDAGRRFVQACWDCRNMDLGAFLHSPLMAELEALEKLRRPSVSRSSVSTHGSLGYAADVSSAGRGSNPSVAAAHAGEHGGHAATEAVPPVDAVMREEGACDEVGDDVAGGIEETGGGDAADKALHCPICLGPMYKPLGLGCGHKFCTECVLRVVGVDGADLLQPLRRTLTNVPHGTACPQCRQRAVFYNAVELTKLGAFIYAKYPEDIEEREQAWSGKLNSLKREKVVKERAERRSRFDQYFQPFGYGL